jgi:hypothetical protein
MRRYSGNITDTLDMLKPDESRFRGVFAMIYERLERS